MLFNKLFKKNFKYIKDENSRFVFKDKIDLSNSSLSKDVKSNEELFKKIFKNDYTFISRIFTNEIDTSKSFCIIYFDGMVNSDILARDIVKPIIESKQLRNANNAFSFVKDSLLFTNEITVSEDINEIAESIMYGDTLIFVNGYSKALIISTKGWAKRSIEEPENETVLRGPREGFNESILQNITMLKRKLITSNLCVEKVKLGRVSNTKLAIVYIDGIVNKSALSILKSRLNKIDIDAVLDSNYIDEIIRDHKFSPFKTIGISERPDTICSKLLEGRMALIVDGSPVVLTVPYLFIEYFQTTDDYYVNFYYASFGRMLRMLSFLVSISIPALYLCFVNYHFKILPINLLLSIATARQSVPFPSLVEVIIFLGMFEILREASVHMPPNVNQALGVVGGLVVGQAAVEARLISAPIVIVIALSGITGIMIPSLKSPVIIYRILLIVLASIIGIYGYVFGILYISLYLYSIESFGIPYMSPLQMNKLQKLKDTGIRVPWTFMLDRPEELATRNIKRQIKYSK